MKTISRIAAIACLLATASPALAQGLGGDAAERKALRQYCGPDIQRLCPNIEPGGGRIKACLLGQKEQMSVGCAKALQQLKQSK